MKPIPQIVAALIACLAVGCASVPCCDPCSRKDKSPKALLSWQIGEKEADEKKNGNGDDKNSESAKDKSDEKNGDKDNKENSNGEKKASGDAKNANGNGDQAEEPEDDDEIVTDRPDFTEASSTVGRGRVQLEAGYLYGRNKDTGVSNFQSYPEALLRIGMFANWFEFRIGQNFTNSREFDGSGALFSTGGGTDLYLGFKAALTEQKKCLPETAVIVQMTVPTGHPSVTSEKVLPGINYLYGWDIFKDCLSAGGSLQGNMAVDDDGHSYLVMAESFTINYTLTKKLGAFTEAFGFQPSSATSPGVGPEYYIDGGFTYKLTPNLQLDIRGAVGLNNYAADYLVGTGFAVRF